MELLERSTNPHRLSARFLTASRTVIITGCLLAAGSVAAARSCETLGFAGQGFDTERLCRVLDGFQTDETNLHGLIIERHGAIVAERYRAGKDRSVYSLFARTIDFSPTIRHDMRSISKSVTSLLWGIAQAEHKTPPLDSPVLDLFPSLGDLKAGGREAITIAHLLSMTSGLSWNESDKYGLGNDELSLYWRASQERYVLGRSIVSPAGTRFHYNGGSTAILANLLEQRVGMPFTEYVRQRLFAPLDIVDWEWMRDMRGRPLAFSGLRMRPRDLAKIGQLILQHGKWNGRQIVPEDWIDASLRPHADVGDGRQYGYQWWLGMTKALGTEKRWSAAFGNGGQRLFIVPSLDLVVVITAGVYDDEAGAIKVNQLFHQVAAAVEK
jgi:CubicO group peptidase (beta-lactamase class C family)